MSENNETKCTCFGMGSLIAHCPIHGMWPDEPQPESEVKPCPTKHQSESTLKDLHPSGSNAAPQGSEPPAGAARAALGQTHRHKNSDGSEWACLPIGQVLAAVEGVIAALNETITQRDEAQKDTARLDWLEGHWEQVFQRICSGGFFYFDTNEQRQKHEPTLRAAIDAAIAAKTEGGV